MPTVLESDLPRILNKDNIVDISILPKGSFVVHVKESEPCDQSAGSMKSVTSRFAPSGVAILGLALTLVISRRAA